MLTVPKCLVQEKSFSAMHQFSPRQSWPQGFDTLPEFGLTDEACSISNWWIDTANPAWWCPNAGWCPLESLNRGFSYLAHSINIEKSDLPGCSHKITCCLTQYFDHLGLSWIEILCQEQERCLSGFSMLLPPVHLQRRDAEAYETQHNHVTYLWKQGTKLKSAQNTIKAKCLLPFVAPCIFPSSIKWCV